MRIKEVVQFGLLPVDGQGVMSQIVSSQAEKDNLLRQRVTDQSGRRGICLDTCLYV